MISAAKIAYDVFSIKTADDAQTMPSGKPAGNIQQLKDTLLEMTGPEDDEEGSAANKSDDVSHAFKQIMMSKVKKSIF